MKTTVHRACILIISLFLCARLMSQDGILTTVAGTGAAGYTGDDGPATAATLRLAAYAFPNCLAMDSSGNLYLADTNNYAIRKISTQGTITTVAGTGSYGGFVESGTATQIPLQSPYAIAIQPGTNTLYIADAGCERIRKVANGIISTAAGNGTYGFSGDGGVYPATYASIAISSYRGSMGFDSDGNLYFADAANARIRKVDTGGYIWTVAGNGSYSFAGDNSDATNSGFNNSFSAAVDAAGNIYVGGWDSRIFQVRNAGTRTVWRYAGDVGWTYSSGTDNGPAVNAGLSIGYNDPAMTTDPLGNLYFSEAGRIRRIDSQTGTITTICGTGTSGNSADGTEALQAQIGRISGLAVDAATSTVYFADSDANTVRKFQLPRDAMQDPPPISMTAGMSGRSSVDFTFQNDSYFSSYTIQRSLNANFNGAININNGTSSPISDTTTLFDGITYHYRLKAQSPSGKYTYSSTVSVTINPVPSVLTNPQPAPNTGCGTVFTFQGTVPQELWPPSAIVDNSVVQTSGIGNNTFSASVGPLAGGTHIAGAVSHDGGGNIVATFWTFDVDTQPPTVNVSNCHANKGIMYIAFSFNDNYGGLKVYVDGVYQTYCNGVSDTLSLQFPATGGSHTFSFSDAFGNFANTTPEIWVLETPTLSASLSPPYYSWYPAQVNLTWSQVTNAYWYQVERSIDGADFQAIWWGMDPLGRAFSEAVSPDGSILSYRVRAIDFGGQESDAQSISVAVNPQPSIFSNSLSTQINTPTYLANTLNWGTTLEGAFLDGNPIAFENAWPDFSCYVDSLWQGWHRFVVVVDDGAGNFRAEYKDFVVGTNLAAPANLHATIITNHSIILEWQDMSDNETGFNIWRSSSQNGPFVLIGQAGQDQTTFVDGALPNLDSFWYFVESTNEYSSSRSSMSNVVAPKFGLVGFTVAQPSGANISTQSAGCPFPVTIKAVDYNGNIFAGFQGTAIVRALNMGNMVYAGQASFSNGVSPSNAIVINSSGLCNIVASRLGGSETGMSNIFSVVAPILKSVSISPAAADVNAGSTRQFTALGADQLGHPMAATFSWSATGGSVSSYGTFSASVDSLAGQGSVTASSGSFHATAYIQIQGGASLLKATAASSTEADLRWISNSNNETGFKIERKETVFGPYVWIAEVGPGVVAWHDSGLQPNQRYFYRIQAYNADGNLPYSNEAAITTPSVPGLAPDAPSGLTAVINAPGGVNLNWEDHSSNEREFRIERKEPEGIFSLIKIAAANDTSYVDAAASVGIQYTYRVQAANESGLSPYSNSVILPNNAVAPSFSNKIPTGWVADRRPAVSAHIDGNAIDASTLEVGLYRLQGPARIAISGVTPVLNGATMNLSLSDDLDDGHYVVEAKAASGGQVGSGSWEFFLDATPPLITGLPDTFRFENGYISVPASFFDSGSGVSSVSWTSGAVDMTAQCVVGENTIRFQPPGPYEPEVYNYLLTVTDIAGNTATADCIVIVGDLDAPVIVTATPAEGEFRSGNATAPLSNRLLAVSYTDYSGADPFTAQFSLTRNNVTYAVPSNLLTVSPTTVQYDLVSGTQYPDGEYTWKVRIWDAAGNGPAEFESSFVLDSTPPSETAVLQKPIDDTIINDITINLTDGAGCGIDWGTLAVTVDCGGQSIVAPLTTHTYEAAVLVLPHSISGTRTIHLTVRDRIGNLLQFDRTQTLALDHFECQRPLNTWVPFDDLHFLAEYNPSTWQKLRVSYADGVDPDSFTVNGVSPDAAHMTIDTQQHTITFEFQVGGITSLSLDFAISGNAQNATFSYLVTCIGGFYSIQPVQPPEVFITSPSEGEQTNHRASISVQIIDPYLQGVSDAFAWSEVQLKVDGSTKTPLSISRVGLNSLLVEYAPSVPWQTGPHTISVTAKNIFQVETTTDAHFTVLADTVAPAIVPISHTVIRGPHPAFQIQVSDGDTGVDTAYTAVSDDNVTFDSTVPDDTTPDIDKKFTFTDPASRLDGQIVTYTVRARDRAMNTAIPVVFMTTIDCLPPVLNNCTILSNSIVDPQTLTVSIDVTDAHSDVKSVSATLNGQLLDTLQYPQQQTCTFNISLEAYKRYELIFTATDEVGHSDTFHRTFIAGHPDNPPRITITPGDGTTTSSRMGQVEVVDSGSGLDPDNVTVVFDTDPASQNPVALIPDNVSVDVATGTWTLEFTMPRVLTGAYMITVDATDNSDLSATAINHFQYFKVQPGAPIVDSISAEPELVTLKGHVPLLPFGALSFSAQAQNADVVKADFNTQTGSFKVVLKRQTFNTAAYDLYVTDSDGYQSAHTTGSGTFAASQSGGQPSHPDGSPQPVGTPSGAATQNDPGAISIYWDFDPADITGVTKPRLVRPETGEVAGGNPMLTKNRGWIPATKKDSCKLVGIVRGGEPPYTATISGNGVHGNPAPNWNGVSFDMQVTFTEGLNKNIKITVRDKNNKQVESFSRNLYYDKTVPMAQAGTDHWLVHNLIHGEIRGDYFIEPWYHSQRYPDPPAPMQTFIDEKLEEGSGIARLDIAYANTVDQSVSLIPRDTEVDAFAFLMSDDNYVREEAWTAKFPIPPPNGAAGNPVDGAVYTLNTPDNGQTYDPLSFAITMNAVDAAGNISPALEGTLTPRVYSQLPHVIPAKEIMLLKGYGAGGLITITPTGGVIPSANESNSITLTRSENKIVRRETPGVFDVLQHRNDSDPNDGMDDSSNENYKIRVVAPNLKIDENNDNSTKDEDRERQIKYGVLVPINDDFEIGTSAPVRPDFTLQGGSSKDKGLRLVTFDETLSKPKPDWSSQDPVKQREWPVALRSVTIAYSSNLRLWRSKNKGTGDAIGSPDPNDQQIVDKYIKKWDLTNDADYADFESLRGKFYVECLPDSESAIESYPHSERRYIDWTPRFDSSEFGDSAANVRLCIHGVSDKNEGIHSGGACVAVAANAEVELSSGALKCSWPAARSESPVIPGINIYYDSRDCIGGEINSRLLPFPRLSWRTTDEGLTPMNDFYGYFCFANSYSPELDARLTDLRRHFRHTLEMRLIRGSKRMMLIEGDGTRIQFEPAAAVQPDTLETAITWKPEQRKGDLSEIKLVKQSVFTNENSKYGHYRMYYVLKRPNENKQYLFEADTGKLLEIRDVFNNAAKLEYEEYGGTRGRLKRVSDNLGNLIQFESDEYGDMSITDLSGVATRVTETGVKGRFGDFTFLLNGNDRICMFSDARGSKYTINPEDQNFQEETTDIPPANPHRLENAVVSTTFGVVYTVLRQEDGRSIAFTHQFDNSKCVVQHYYLAGDTDRSSEFTYDRAKNVWASHSLPGGTVTLTQTPDEFGQVKKVTNLYNGATEFTYDSCRLKTIVDSDGVSVAEDYVTITNPNRKENEAPYNYLENATFKLKTVTGKGKTDYGNSFQNKELKVIIQSSENAGGSSAASTVTVFHDTRGLVTRVEGPKAGAVSTYERDGTGRLKSTSITGAGIAANACKTEYATDVFGQAYTVKLPSGRLIRHWFDAFGRTTITQGPLLANGEKTAPGADIEDGGDTAVFYDAGGAWISMRDADGRTVSRTINTLGAVERAVSASSATTEFSDFDADLNPIHTKVQVVDATPGGSSGQVTLTHAYDLFGREISVTCPSTDGDRMYQTIYKEASKTVEFKEPSNAVSAVQQFKPSGRLKAVTDLLKRKTEPSYDAGGRVQSITSPGMAQRICRTDRNGAVIESGIPEVGLTTTIQRDELGMASNVALPGGLERTRNFDELGRLKSSKVRDLTTLQLDYRNDNPLFQFTPEKATDMLSGAVTTTLRTDAHGRPVNWTTAESGAIVFTGAGEYADAAVPASRDVIGAAKYLNDGQPLYTKDGNGNNTTNDYSGPGMTLKSITDPAQTGPSVERHLSGAIKKSTAPSGETSTYIYDDFGELKAIKYGGDSGVAFQYDQDGRVVRETHAQVLDGDGNPVGSGPALYVVQNHYDGLGRLEWVEDPEGSGNDTHYTYYDHGRVQTVANADGQIKYTYDRAGRKTDIDGPGKRHTHYEYHASGQIAQVQHADGRVEAYTYDNYNRLKTKTVTGQGTLTYDYNTSGDLWKITDSNNNVTQFVYDNQHRCVKTTLPGGKESTVGYDKAGFAIRKADPNGHDFVIRNKDNGLPEELKVVDAQNPQTLRSLQSYQYDGYTPTSDGGVQWTLDWRGRVAESRTSGGAAIESFEYLHPRGLMTKKSYAGIELNYAYDGSFLHSISDGVRGVTFGRTPAGLLESETYANGIVKSYQYNTNLDVKSLTYAANGGTLAGFTIGYEAPGRRSSLTIAPTGEQIKYGYDAGFRLNKEEQSLDGVASATTYTYDTVGTRLTRAIEGVGTDKYHINGRYELEWATLADGTRLNYKYDHNGNTVEKSRAVNGTLVVSYRNLNEHTLTYSFKCGGIAGPKVDFPPTDVGYRQIVLSNVPLGEKVGFVVLPEEAAGCEWIYIEKIEIRTPDGAATLLAEAAEHSTDVVLINDPLAEGGKTLAFFGDEATDWITWTTPTALTDVYTYGWNELNHMTSAAHTVDGDVVDQGTFARAGGWQMSSMTINNETRAFTYGYDGAVLSETVPNFGTRTYVNAGIDHAMWSIDSVGNNPVNYWLHDLNGSIYGIANTGGSVIERQRMDAFGKVKVTDAAGVGIPTSVVGNIRGFQGLGEIPKFAMGDARNRPYDRDIGRFMTRDHWMGMVDGPNVYNAYRSNPANCTDPMGTSGLWNWSLWDLNPIQAVIHIAVDIVAVPSEAIGTALGTAAAAGERVESVMNAGQAASKTMVANPFNGEQRRETVQNVGELTRDAASLTPGTSITGPPVPPTSLGSPAGVSSGFANAAAKTETSGVRGAISASPEENRVIPKHLEGRLKLKDDELAILRREIGPSVVDPNKELVAMLKKEKLAMQDAQKAIGEELLLEERGDLKEAIRFRAERAEQQCWLNALKEKHIGIQAPGGLYERGPDCITLDTKSWQIVAWDATIGSKTTVPSDTLKKWLPEIKAAIESMESGPRRDWAREAFQKGKIRTEVWKAKE